MLPQSAAEFLRPDLHNETVSVELVALLALDSIERPELVRLNRPQVELHPSILKPRELVGLDLGPVLVTVSNVDDPNTNGMAEFPFESPRQVLEAMNPVNCPFLANHALGRGDWYAAFNRHVDELE